MHTRIIRIRVSNAVIKKLPDLFVHIDSSSGQRQLPIVSDDDTGFHDSAPPVEIIAYTKNVPRSALRRSRRPSSVTKSRDSPKCLMCFHASTGNTERSGVKRSTGFSGGQGRERLGFVTSSVSRANDSNSVFSSCLKRPLRNAAWFCSACMPTIRLSLSIEKPGSRTKAARFSYSSHDSCAEKISHVSPELI
ncbi:hypothetical protein LZ32DRAFT_149448 [Colletotrichum eremochloae]|nr:hypothetical protein LZ32DRAFT_149448 [Colletotrichum eremochloae]